MTIRGRPSRASVHRRLAEEVQRLHNNYGGLPSPADAEAIWTDIWYREAHNSTAIEGNTLVLREVEQLLNAGRAVGGKPLKDYLEVSGYAAAAQWVYGQALEPGDWTAGDLLSLAEVRHVHALAMGPVWEVAPHPSALDSETPGNWRQHDIHPFPDGMTPPDHTQIQALMTDWVRDANALRQEPGLIAEAAATHHAAFERIHPFLDGNGRAGRLLMNLALVRLGYPPAVILSSQRSRYLKALDRADRGDSGPLGELVARAILSSLTRFVLPALADSDDALPLDALATPGIISAVALRAAAQRGRLFAIRNQHGAWLSTRELVDEYLASRYADLRRPRSS